jgi:1-deoxy-D-xylulose 5-phosphate reductoisomerase
MTNTVRVSVLGASGSIGVSALDVIASGGQGSPEFSVIALTANRNVEALAAAARRARAEIAVVADEACYGELKSALAGSGVEVAAGDAAIAEAGARKADVVVAGIVGIAGLAATLSAVRQGASIALANKESMVCAGKLLREEARQSGARLLPIDSEHNAIFQVLDRPERVEKLILTASGGPFRSASLQEMAAATPEKACAHPNWDMGAKISVDSATMMNKGLELIEAAYLFDVPESRIDVLIHPQSIIHDLGGARNGATDAVIGSATADVGVHAVGDLLFGGLGRRAQERRSSQHLARLAPAALHDVEFLPGSLNGLACRRIETFDRGDLLSGERGCRRHAGPCRLAVHKDSAGTAGGDTAAELRAGKFQVLTQVPEQGPIFLARVFLFLAVDRQLHGNPPPSASEAADRNPRRPCAIRTASM